MKGMIVFPGELRMYHQRQLNLVQNAQKSDPSMKAKNSNKKNKS
jgi:hypothetical protein